MWQPLTDQPSFKKAALKILVSLLKFLIILKMHPLQLLLSRLTEDKFV